MNLWNDFIELLIKGKDLILGLSAEQITLISVVVTLVIFMAGQRSETKFKKHEVRRAEYKKFIELLQKSLSGGIKPDEKGKQEFFDTGVSLLLYGSKRVYKKYIFFREYTINPIVQKSKYNDNKVLLYVVADILKAIRHEVGLTSISDLESNEALSFFVNDIGTNPLSRIESYKSRYNIVMIKAEIFFYNRYKLLTTKKFYYHIIKPIFGVIGMGLKYLLISFSKIGGCIKETRSQQEKPVCKEPQVKNKTGEGKVHSSNHQKSQGFFARVFAVEWKAQRWVAQKIWVRSRLFGKIDSFCLLVFLIFGTLLAAGRIPKTVAYWVLLMLGIAMLICTFLKDSQKAMTTLGGFLQIGMCLMLVVGIATELFIVTTFKGIFAGVTGQYLACVVISFVLALIWGIYSSFCNAGVATLANALLAGMIGLVILTKDLLVNTLFIELPVAMFGDEFTAQIEAIGYSTSQFIDGAFSLLFYPFLLMAGFATMVCASKKYWIDKYNNREDIDSIACE